MTDKTIDRDGYVVIRKSVFNESLSLGALGLYCFLQYSEGEKRDVKKETLSILFKTVPIEIEEYIEELDDHELIDILLVKKEDV